MLYSFISSLIFPILVLILTALLNPHIAHKVGILITLFLIFYVTYGFFVLIAILVVNYFLKKLFSFDVEGSCIVWKLLIPVILIIAAMVYGFFYNAVYFKDAISDSSYNLLEICGFLSIIASIVFLLLILVNRFNKLNLRNDSFIILGIFLVMILSAVFFVEGYKPKPFDAEKYERVMTGHEVSVIGLDALSWDIIDPMMKMGYLPNLSRLKRHGSWGDISTLTPTKSDVIWTSIATGKKPVKHDIKSFFEYHFKLVGTPLEILPKNLFMMMFMNLKLLRVETVKAERRTAAPIWNITGNEPSIGTIAVNWWSSIPPDVINGLVFTNYIYYQKAGYDKDLQTDVTYPSSYSELSSSFKIKDDDVVEEFVTGVPRTETGRFIYKLIKDRIYREDEFYFKVGKYFFRKYSPSAFFFYHNGTDPVAHNFFKYYKAKSEKDIPKDELEIFCETMERYYDYVDSKIPDFLNDPDGNRIFVFLSDHGMVTTPLMMRLYRNYIVKNPYLYGYHDDAINGFLIMAGSDIKEDQHLDSANVCDITPTILYMLGYPIAEDMDGRVLTDAVSGDFLGKYRIKSVESYDRLNRIKGIEHKKSIGDKEAVEKLKSLGYL